MSKYQKYRTKWMREYRKKNVEKTRVLSRAHSTAYRKKYPEKIHARKIVYVAVRNGTLVKKKCFCGKAKVEAHHEDYSKPLKVKWMCRKHHRKYEKIRS
jgi:hypothetical protein